MDSVQSQIVARATVIGAPAAVVWDVLTRTELISKWMLGAVVTSSWMQGSDIEFAVLLPGHDDVFHDRGTVLIVEPMRRLQYNYWAQATGLVDTIQHRSVFDWRLEPRDGATLLRASHTNLPSYEALKHAEFFFPVRTRRHQGNCGRLLSVTRGRALRSSG